MVVLKVGDWVLYQNKDAVNTKPRLCKVLAVKECRADVEVWWADINGWGFANQKYLTPLPEGLTPILSDSIKYGETKWQN
jgi:hypothetical protein